MYLAEPRSEHQFRTAGAAAAAEDTKALASRQNVIAGAEQKRDAVFREGSPLPYRLLNLFSGMRFYIQVWGCLPVPMDEEHEQEQDDNENEQNTV